MNILSKIDLIRKYGDVDYDLEYYTPLPSMTRMLFSVDRQHQSEVQHDKEEEDAIVDNDDDYEGEVCDEEEFVNEPKDPFQKKYRKYSKLLLFK